MKKNIKYLLLFILMACFFYCRNVYAKDNTNMVKPIAQYVLDNQDSDIMTDNIINYENLCSAGNTGIIKAIKIVGNVVSICKWIVPMLIIVFGMIDFGKAVISSDEKAMNKATKSLITRIIIGVVVGLLPTTILAILGLLENLGAEDIYKNSFGACTKCILDVNECE